MLPWFLGLIGALSPASGVPSFDIASVELLNPVVSAGDALDIRYSVSGDESQVCLIGGVSIYLGYIVQNLFPNSDALNRMSVSPSGGAFRVTDLKLSPFSVPTQEYRIEAFFVYDCQGRYRALYASRDGDHYLRANGEATAIPVMKFHLNENPRGDNTAPVIRLLAFEREIYRRGETPRIRFSATDNLSGIGPFAGAYLSAGSSLGQAGVDTRIQAAGGDAYVAVPYTIPADLDAAIDSLVLTEFSVQDVAGTWGGLRLPTVDSAFYETQAGVVTTIPAVRIQVGR